MKSGATESNYVYLSKYLTFPHTIQITNDPRTFLDNSKIRIIWSQHSYDQPCYQNFDHRICDYIVCPSNWLKDQFIKYHKIPESKLIVIPNGVSDKFSYSKNKRKQLIHTSIPYKGCELLPKIFPIVRAAHPDCELYVFSSMGLYGENQNDPYDELYSELIRQPNVHWSPAVDSDLLVEYYKSSALFVHPNIWEETACVSLLEAQRSGCYPIITDIGAIPETSGEIATIVPIEGTYTQKGWKVTDQFINIFARAIIDALDFFEKDREYFDKISQSCANHAARKHDWSVIAGHWDKFLRTIHEKVGR